MSEERALFSEYERQLQRELEWLEDELEDVRAELQAAQEELHDANRALGECLSPESVDDLLSEQTKALREKLAQVLDWPLPNGTVETWSLPGWLAREARALAGQRTEEQSDG